MLSVIHILSSLNTGGAERVTIELAQTQRKNGLDAQILSLGSEQDFLVESVRERNIPFSVVGSPKNRLSRYRKILSIIKRFDVVHCHSPRALLYIAPIVPLFSHKRIIYTRHGLEPLLAAKWKLLHRYIQPFINWATFVTQSGYDVFSVNHHWNPDKLQVIQNGVFVPDEVNVNNELPLRFGSVGRMVELKGQPIFLDALEILAKEFGDEASRMFSVRFFGSGPLESELRQIAEEKIPGLAEFCGEEPEVAKIYNGIDVLVVASRSEGLSMVIMEAMARAKPAVATDVGGNGTLVIHGRTGLLVPYGSPQLLADALKSLVSNHELVEQYGVEARKLIKNKFSLNATHKAYLACYVEPH